MKKLLTGIMAVALIMGMSMPVAAAVYKPEWAGTIDVLCDYMVENLPSPPGSYNGVTTTGYDYYAFFYDSTKWIRVVYSTTPEIKVGDLVYVTSGYLGITNISKPSVLCKVFQVTHSSYGFNAIISNYNTSAGSSVQYGYYLPEYSTAIFSGTLESEKAYIHPVDTSALESLITQAGLKVQSDYTANTWSTLQSALSDAKSLLAGGSYTQDQIDAMYSWLQSALNGLEFIPALPDTTALRAVLAEANAIENTGYTVTSWNTLRVAVYEGEELLTRTYYTAPQVQTATTNVRTGITGLEVYIAPDPGNHRYLVDGIRFVDLLPAKDAIEENMGVAQNLGLYVFAVLLGILVIVRLIKMLLSVFNIGSDRNDANLR